MTKIIPSREPRNKKIPKMSGFRMFRGLGGELNTSVSTLFSFQFFKLQPTIAKQKRNTSFFVSVLLEPSTHSFRYKIQSFGNPQKISPNFFESPVRNATTNKQMELFFIHFQKIRWITPFGQGLYPSCFALLTPASSY